MNIFAINSFFLGYTLFAAIVSLALATGILIGSGRKLLQNLELSLLQVAEFSVVFQPFHHLQ